MDRRTWHPLTPTGGTVNCDRTSETRWYADVTVDSKNVSLDNDNLNAFGCRVRVFRDVWIPRQGWEPVPWGVYRVDGIEQRRSSLRLNLFGLEKQIQDTRFLVPRTIGLGGSKASQTTRATVETLVQEAVPGTEFVWDPALTIVNTSIGTKVTEERDRWGLLDGRQASIAKSLAAEMWFDAQGRFTVGVVPSISGTPVWDVDSGVDGVLVEDAKVLTRDRVFNVVVASGESTDGTTPPPYAIVWDTNPASPTYAGPDPSRLPSLAGPFGVVPRFYSSPFLQTKAQCVSTARAILRNSLGIQKTVSFTSVSNPGLVAGDLIRVRGERFLLDKWSANFGSAFMSCDTRSNKEDDPFDELA